MPQVGTIKIWTFEDCRFLLDAMNRIGVKKIGSIEAFGETSPSPRRIKDVTEIHEDIKFARILGASGVHSESGALLEAILEISPYDPRFPQINWGLDLPRERSSMRRTAASRIAACYLRNLESFPSVLTIKLKPSPSNVLEEVFARFCHSLPISLRGLPDVFAVGVLDQDFVVLPPESLANRMEQIPSLRGKIDRLYPVIYLGEKQGGLWISKDLENSVEKADFPRGLLIDRMSEEEYLHLMVKRGIYETPDGIIFTGSREDHALHAQACAYFASMGQSCCSLLDDIGQKLSAGCNPFLLTTKDRCTNIALKRAEVSAQRQRNDAFQEIAESLLRELSEGDDKFDPATIRILRSLLPAESKAVGSIP